MATENQALVIGKGRKGPRAGGPRSRTGCATCRIRRVKCDEEKPACNKCRSTGRACDGYENPGKRIQMDVPSMLYSKIYGLSSDMLLETYQTSLSTKEERHCFEYFHCNTRQQINTAFLSSTHVHRLVFQASHMSTSVKHLMIALGSLTENLDAMKVSPRDPFQEKQRMQYADDQYLKSISQLRKDMNNSVEASPELVLVSCLLLSLFDFLRGEEADARVHLAAGIDILRNCFASELRALLEKPSAQDGPPSPLVQNFALIFSVVDRHAALWLGRPVFYSLPMIEPPLIPPLPYKPGSELTLAIVSDILNHQYVCAHSFHHENAHCYDLLPISSSEPPQIPFPVLAEKARLLYDLHQWPSILDQCISTLPPTVPLTREQINRIALMRMNYHSLHIAISTFFCSPPQHGASFSSTAFPSTSSVHESLITDFAAILSNARLIFSTTIDPTSVSTDPYKAILEALALNCREPDPFNMPLFAFSPGTIQPLYIVAAQAPVLAMREEALAFLEQRTWREGAWDSSIMARLARREWEREQPRREEALEVNE